MTTTSAQTSSPGKSRKLYRAMIKTAEGRPQVGTGDAMLGARAGIDVRPAADGTVKPGGGGMSVTPDDPARLPPHFRPKKLGGFGGLPVFGIPEPHLGANLSVRFDARKPDKHAFIEPARVMPTAEYQEALGATAASWKEWS